MSRLERERNNHNYILIGWLCLLIPYLGPFMSIYFDYKALCLNERTAKLLAYAIYIVMFIESYNFTVWNILMIISFAVIVGVLMHYTDACSIRDFIHVINSFLDKPRYRYNRKGIDISNVNVEMSDIDNLNGDQFEIYMVKLLRSVGFQHVVHTPFSNDGGLDAIGYLPDGKTKVGWQFKHYSQGKIGYDAVEQTACGGLLYNTQYNYLLTNRPKLTDDALAKIKQINQNMNSDYIIVDTRNSLLQLVKMNIDHLHFDKNMDIQSNNVHPIYPQKESDVYDA